MRIEVDDHSDEWTWRVRAESCDMPSCSSRSVQARLRCCCWAIQLLVLLFASTLTTYAQDSRISTLIEGQGTPAAPAASGPIVVQNAYYPKPGLEEDVYQLRLRASAVRAQLGLPEGRVLRRLDGPDGAAYVIWEAEYADSAVRERDVARLSTNAEFDGIQKQMGTLLLRFERSVWQVAPAVRPR